MLELLFKGLLQWLFDMLINITEYLANSLLNIIPLGSHQFPASEPPGNGIFHLQSHHNILWQHTYLISL